MNEENAVKIYGTCFDGVTSKSQMAYLSADTQRWRLELNAQLYDYDRPSLKIQKPLGRLPCVIDFPDGKRFETPWTPELQKLSGKIPSRISLARLESSWRLVIGAVLALVTALCVGYFFVLPRFARSVAPIIPSSFVTLMSEQARLVIETSRLFKPSALSPEQKAVAESAGAMLQKDFPSLNLSLNLRQGGSVGANAFAMPDGVIYMTDELVKLTPDRNHLYAVLLHEAGHVKYRHALQMLIANSGLGLVLFSLVGGADFTGISFVLLSSSYSREFETEADDFAAVALKQHQLRSSLLAEDLEALEKSHQEKSPFPSFLASHPATHERIERLRLQR